jgi:hypothetical protein
MGLKYETQNDLLLKNLMKFYNKNDYLDKIIKIINGQSELSIRIIDWFVTNYAKKNFVKYPIERSGRTINFKVYIDYKLKLKAYSKKRFDPFCRWDRITIPYSETEMVQTTIGQLNFFKWALENKIIDYIQNNKGAIEDDMNRCNTLSKKNKESLGGSNNKTRKKREELSVSAIKSIKKENIEIIMKFN